MKRDYILSSINAGVGVAYILVGARATGYFLDFIRWTVHQPEEFFTNKMLYLLIVSVLAMGLGLYLVLRVGVYYMTSGLKQFSELRKVKP